MATMSRRTVASRSSRRGVFRTPSRVSFPRKRPLLRVMAYDLRDYAASDTFTYSITETSVLLRGKAVTDTFTYSITESSVVSKPIDKGPATDTFTYNFTDHGALNVSIIDKPVSDTWTYSLTQTAVVSKPIDKSASDTFTYSITESETGFKTKPGADTFTYSITDAGARHSLAPVTGTWLSPPHSVPITPVAGSRISWVQGLDGTVLVETSVDNAGTWQTATNGASVPHLIPGTTTVQAVLIRVTLTRLSSDDPSPYLSRLELDVDSNATIREYIPLGVFTLNETDITDTGTGLEIDIQGNDLSRRISRNQWDAVKVIPIGTNFGTAIQQIVSDRLPGTDFNFTSTEEVTPRLTFGAQGQNDPWADILDMAEAIGNEIFFDARGVCTMRPEPDPEIQEPVWTFSDAARPVMTGLQRRITDEDTANYIIVTGENSSNDTPPARAIAIDNDPTSPTYYQGPFGTVTYRITSPLVKNNDQALIMAQNALLRRKGATELVEIDAVPMAALEPSDIVFVQRDMSKIAGRFLVDQTTIPLGAEETMHVVTRRQKLAASRPPAGGVGGLDGNDTTTSGNPPVTADSFTVAFGACINASDASCLSDIAAVTPDWFVNLGDVWYKDGVSPNWVADWNTKFAASHYAALIAALPDSSRHVVGWSDHDFGYNNNVCGLDNPSRTASANAAYRTKFGSSGPLVQNATLPSNGIYRTWTVGRVRFILLDMLTFKDKLNKTDNSSKTMLGNAQKVWLGNLLKDSSYPLIVIFGDGQLPGPKEALQDEWRGYDTERQALGAAVNASPAKCIYINGDTHCLAAGHDQYGFKRVWQAAPFHNNTKVKAKGAGYLVTYPTNANEGGVAEQWGHITFQDSGTQITATYRAVSGGAIKFTDTFSVSAGSSSGGGGQQTAANPAQRHRIGQVSGWNRVNLGVGVSGGDHVDVTFPQLTAGFSAPGYYELTPDGLRVRMSAHLDGGTTPGSSYPRTEYRELNLDGSSHASWDPDSGTHYVKCIGRIIKLPSVKPELVIAQAHDGSDDTIQLRVEDNDIVVTVNGSTVHTASNVVNLNQDYFWGLSVTGSGSSSVIRAYWNNTTTPIYTSGSAGRSNNWYWKAGCYGQSNDSVESTSHGPFIIEMSRLEIWHTGYPTPVGFY